jgi:D-glycero-beta-D-manno-heptose 1-phosphate adenylyltransferase
MNDTTRFFDIGQNPTATLDLHRDEGRRIVSINGCFDILHAGHIHILQEAANQGEVLVVGLNSDASVRANKGPSRPMNPQQERAETLLALEMVDIVVLYDEPDCIEFVHRVRPDIHVNDASYGEDCIEAAAVKEGGGRLHLVQKHPSPSTTDIIDKVKDAESQ